MTSWISEKDYRQDKAAGLGIGLNAAFIREIKEDNVEFRDLFDNVESSMIAAPNLPDREQVILDLHRSFMRLRDELETYFALEEFYGGYRTGGDPGTRSASELSTEGDLSRHVEKLRQQHIDLYLELDRIVESVEKMVYGETPADQIDVARQEFLTFCHHLRAHEAYEMEIIMRHCNEELGGGG